MPDRRDRLALPGDAGRRASVAGSDGGDGSPLGVDVAPATA